MDPCTVRFAYLAAHEAVQDIMRHSDESRVHLDGSSAHAEPTEMGMTNSDALGPGPLAGGVITVASPWGPQLNGAQELA